MSVIGGFLRYYFPLGGADVDYFLCCDRDIWWVVWRFCH